MALILAGAPPTAAQADRPAQDLAPALGAPAGEFTRIKAIRELADGTLLVLHRDQDHPLVRLDFATGRQTAVLRRGRGPGEIHSASTLIPLSGDSTLVPDGALRRWLLLAGHQVAATVRAEPAELASLIGFLVGAEHLGSVLVVRPVTIDGTPALPGTADSVVIARANRVTGRIDTLALARAGPKGMYRGGHDTRLGRLNVLARNPLSVDEQAIQFADGWVAVAQLAPYRVTWISGPSRPSGAGPPSIPRSGGRRCSPRPKVIS